MFPSRHRISFSAWFFKKQPSGRQILKSALNSDVRRQHAEDTSPSICIIPLPTPPYPPAPAPAPRTALNAITSPPSQLLTAQSLVVVVLRFNSVCGKRKLPKQKKTPSLVCPQRLESMFFHSSSRLSCNLQKSVNARHFCPWRSPDHGMVLLLLLLLLADTTFVLSDLCKIQKNL